MPYPREANLLYDGFLIDIAKLVNAKIGEIRAEENFTLGPEFEIAICKLLRMILPSNCGVCRGHAITREGQKAGDDILVFDRSRFPLLRLLDQDDFGQLMRVPVGAVFAYVEAKHTVYLDSPRTKQSLEHALAQVDAVRSLPRPPVPPVINGKRVPPAVVPYLGRRIGRHGHLNPIFGAVVARHVRATKGSKILSADEISKRLTKRPLPQQADTLVLGSDIIVLPIDEAGHLVEYYTGPGVRPTIFETPGASLAICLAMVANAVSTIELGEMPWFDIVRDVLQPMGEEDGGEDHRQK